MRVFPGNIQDALDEFPLWTKNSRHIPICAGSIVMERIFPTSVVRF